MALLLGVNKRTVFPLKDRMNEKNLEWFFLYGVPAAWPKLRYRLRKLSAYSNGRLGLSAINMIILQYISSLLVYTYMDIVLPYLLI
jgi:hypothetical protein